MAASSKKVILAALAGNSLIAVTKLAASAITGSSAMLSEGIHSIVDTGNQALLLLGLKRAARPADERFPFGHGKEVYFWSFVVALLIFAVGAGVSVYEGIKHLIDPHPIENPGINYIVLALAFVFEGVAWTIALKEFRRTKGRRGYLEAVSRGKDPALFVVLFEDTAAMLGILVAFAGIGLGQITGSPYFDGAASIVIGLILAATAAWLAYETHGLLIGERAERETVREIRERARALAGVEAVNEVLTLHMGPDYILATLSLDFSDSLSVPQLEASIAQLEREIRAALPTVKRIFIEAEPVRRILPAAPQPSESGLPNPDL